jgi:hypothetical protein
MADQGAGWQDLLAILKQGAEERAAERAQGPLACPNDGEPLTSGPDGRLFCRFDGWKP